MEKSCQVFKRNFIVFEEILELLSNFNEMHFKEMIIHTIVTLRNSINTAIKQKNLTSPTKKQEVPIENPSHTEHDCVKCRIF